MRVAVTTRNGGIIEGESRGVYDDGTTYVVLDRGGAANFPTENVHPLEAVEDKDLRLPQLETK